MKLNSDTLTTIFGSIASISQLLGQSHVLNANTSGTISAIALALLGLFANKSIKTSP